MPVVFRCEYCHGKLSIARRKIGTNIVCPKCTMEIIVPDLPEPVYESPAADPEVLEDAPLHAELEIVAPPPPPPQMRMQHAPSAPRRKDSLFEGDDIERILNEKIGPEALPEEPKPSTNLPTAPPVVDHDAFVISRMKATLLLVAAVIGMGLSFLFGFLIRGIR